MKKLLAITLIGSFAMADFLSISGGAGMWNENISGYTKSGSDINYFNKDDGNPDTGNLKLQDKVRPYVWVKLIHPIPLVPNLKVQYTRYSTSGRDGTVVGSVDVFGETITGAGTADTDMSINSYDATFFYELKSALTLGFEIEAGVGVNVLDGTTDLTINKTDTTHTTWTIGIPYLYGRVETPTFFGFSAEAQAKYLDIDTAYYHDYQTKVKYHLPLPIIDLTMSAGYRTQTIYGEDGDKSTKLKYNGIFAEVGARW